MKTRSRFAIALAFAALLAAPGVFAAVTDVRGLPRQATVVASGGNLVNVTWRVTTTADHASGVISSSGLILDPSSGRVLQRIGGPLGAGGAGPFVLREAVGLDAATVADWADQGLRRVVLERTFTDPATGATVDAAIVLAIARSPLAATREAAPAELSVVSLQLEFDTGTNVAIVDADAAVRAMLTVQYTGTGILRGRWQVAEPGASEGVALYRTLSLVNANLQTNQRSRLASPVLPSARAGTYLLRFCVSEAPDTEPVEDALCPDEGLVATAVYQVREGGNVARIGDIAPDRATVSAATPFRWQPLAGSAVYRLQIFEPAASSAGPGVRDAGDASLRFVTGMLLGGSASSTTLSDLVRSRLQPGRRYVWRVTAYDEWGRIVGSSAEASFVYGPG